MNRLLLGLLHLALFGGGPFVRAARLDSTQTRELAQFERQFDARTGLSGKTLRYNLHFAALLYERSAGNDRPRADAILTRVMAYQDTVADTRTYGQFPFSTDSKLGDQNVALFMAAYYFRELWSHQSRMAPPVADQFRRSAARLIEAAERRWDEEVFDLRRDYKAYTNVFVMYINAVQLGGKYLASERLLRKAEAQWTRWFNHVSYYGIDEFTSPSYSNVDAENLLDIYHEARTDRMRYEVGLVLDFLTIQQYGIAHPLLKLPICGSSRDYRSFQQPGNLEVDLVRNTRTGSWQKPDRAVQSYARRVFPHEVTGRATDAPFRYKSYQTPTGGMGSMTGGNYFWQQIHLMVAVGRSEQQRDVAFLPGSFTPINGYVAQRGNTALCLFSRSPTTYHRTQARTPDAALAQTFGGFGVGITAGWQEIANETGRLVLHAHGQALHVYPFTIAGGKLMPVKLRYKKRDQITEKNYHQRPADFGEYVFPDEVSWIGCWVTYGPVASRVNGPNLAYSRRGSQHTLKAGGGLSIQLTEQPTGELVELYDHDWRTLPLLQTPTQTVWPGELTRQATNGAAPK